MVAELCNDYKQVICIYCSKLIQIKSTQTYHSTTRLLFSLPLITFFELIFNDREFAWYWWAGNAVLAVICYLAWRPMHLKQKTAKFYEEPRFNRSITSRKS